MDNAWHIFSQLFCSWKTQTKQNYYVILRDEKYIFEPNIEDKRAKKKAISVPWQTTAFSVSSQFHQYGIFYRLSILFETLPKDLILKH